MTEIMKKVKYIGCSEDQIKFGGGNNDPRTILKVDNIYHVLKEEVHAWHTKFILQEFPEWKFNSVSFIEVE